MLLILPAVFPDQYFVIRGPVFCHPQTSILSSADQYYVIRGPVLCFKPDSQATRDVNLLGNNTELDDKIFCPELLPGELETFLGKMEVHSSMIGQNKFLSGAPL